MIKHAKALLRSTIGGKAVFLCSGFNSFLDLAAGFPMVALSAKGIANVCHFEHLECFGKAFLSCCTGLVPLRLWTYGTIYIGGVVSILYADLWLGYIFRKVRRLFAIMLPTCSCCKSFVASPSQYYCFSSFKLHVTTGLT